MKITNHTEDQSQVKICIYNQDDSWMWIPVGAGVFVVEQNDTVKWMPPAPERKDVYHVKVFHPQLIDAGLCDGKFAIDADLEIKGHMGKGGGYTIK